MASFSLFFVVFFCLCVLSQAETLRPFLRRINLDTTPKSNNVQYFYQLVDHFDPTNDNKWIQRYTVNNTFYKPGGPVFIFLAGEAPMEFFDFQEVQALNWAAEFNALYIKLEHRFYGDSVPGIDFSTSVLEFLTSQQALADAANFITWMKTEKGYDGKWVVFGCSYSGALSAWFRLKYPDLVVASVAPSGPVEAQLNFTGYLAQFSDSASPNCVSAASKASSEISSLMLSSSGRQMLAQTFNACDTTIAEEDSYFFLYNLADVLGGADQMSNPPDWELNSTCNMLLSSDDYVTNWGQIFTEASGGQCTDFSEANFITSMQNTLRMAIELGPTRLAYPGTSVFFPTLDVEHQVKWCEQIFGIPGMTPNIAKTNAFYGATNVMFTNGNLDPWHLLSINENNAAGTVFAANYEAGHCGSMIAATDIDPPSLTEARKTVSAFLAKVLQD